MGGEWRDVNLFSKILHILAEMYTLSLLPVCLWVCNVGNGDEFLMLIVTELVYDRFRHAIISSTINIQ